MTPAEIWPIIAGSAAVVFGAGQLVEKIRANGTYIKRDLCAAYRKAEDDRWTSLKDTMEKLSAWVDKQRDA